MKCKPTCRVLIIKLYYKYRTNSQKLIAFTLDLNREGDIKYLIEDGREFINDGLKMIEFCKLCQANSCEDREILLLLAIIVCLQ